MFRRWCEQQGDLFLIQRVEKELKEVIINVYVAETLDCILQTCWKSVCCSSSHI